MQKKKKKKMARICLDCPSPFCVRSVSPHGRTLGLLGQLSGCQEEPGAGICKNRTISLSQFCDFLLTVKYLIMSMRFCLYSSAGTRCCGLASVLASFVPRKITIAAISGTISSGTSLGRTILFHLVL